MEINDGVVTYNELNEKSNGGTELMGRRLAESIDKKYLEGVQIILSRVRELDNKKHRVLWCHDLAGDPEAENALANGGWQDYNRIVFVSHWQRQGYLAKYNIPWSKTVVISNGIYPIEKKADLKNREKIRFVYHTTPHRGLEILVPIFIELQKHHDNIELDVYSSFSIYGWEERDEKYEGLFDLIKKAPGMNYKEIVSNEEMRRLLPSYHFYAYPNTWPETSCLSLIEAMSAGLICVHPDFGVLPETSFALNHMYNWSENQMQHASIMFNFLNLLLTEMKEGRDEPIIRGANFATEFADSFYDWNSKLNNWKSVLSAVQKEPTIDLTADDRKDSFTYVT